MNGSTRVFLFGTLRHAPLRDAVLGADLAVTPAVLPDYGVHDAGGFPALQPRAGRRAAGVLVMLDGAALARLDLYEGLFGYARAPVQVATDDAQLTADVYCPATALADGPEWQLDAWVARLGAAATRAAAQVMALARAGHPPDALAVRYPMLLAHAAAQLRAADEAAPATARRHPAADDVASAATAQPYAYFFGVQSDDLRFRRFDGRMSAVVRRAGFVMSDAVTVLPYDPRTDRVLLVEQFRYGPWLRDAANCWMLEAIAGRVDPGENPVDAACREAAEEAGLQMTPDALYVIGQNYPSPAAVSECLFQYVALGDLPDDDGAVGGLDAEAEDIRRHVIGFDRLMALIGTGEVQSGPLLVSAFWLGLNRARLRGG